MTNEQPRDRPNEPVEEPTTQSPPDAWAPPEQGSWSPPPQQGWAPPAAPGWSGQAPPPDQPSWQAGRPYQQGQSGWQPPQQGWQPEPARRGGNRGGIILVAVLVGVLVVAIGAFIALFGSGLGTLADRTPIGQIDVGECFDGVTAGASETDNAAAQLALLLGVVRADCAEPHDAELIARFGWPTETTEYPGTSQVESFSAETCGARFGEYVGTVFDRSRLEMTYTYPLEPQWSAGERTFECIALAPVGEGKLTGSVRNSRR